MSRVEVEVFHDGQCPLCQRERQLLQRLDRANAIRFVDISAEVQRGRVPAAGGLQPTASDDRNPWTLEEDGVVDWAI